jgi:hypothetical protein
VLFPFVGPWIIQASEIPNHVKRRKIGTFQAIAESTRECQVIDFIGTAVLATHDVVYFVR